MSEKKKTRTQMAAEKGYHRLTIEIPEELVESVRAYASAAKAAKTVGQPLPRLHWTTDD